MLVEVNVGVLHTTVSWVCPVLLADDLRAFFSWTSRSDSLRSTRVRWSRIYTHTHTFLKRLYIYIQQMCLSKVTYNKNICQKKETTIYLSVQ